MANADILFVFISLFTIIGNTLTVIAFVQVRDLHIKPSNLLIFALSITDLIYGSYMFVFYGIPMLCQCGNIYREIGCLLSEFLEYTYFAGNLLLIAIGVDRVLLVSFNYSRYVKFQTSKRIQIAIVVCYAVGLVGAFIEIGFWNFAKRNNEVAANINFNEYCLFPPRRMRLFGLYISIVFYCIPLLMIIILSTLFFIRLRLTIKKKRHIGNTIVTVSAHLGNAGSIHGDSNSNVGSSIEEGGNIIKRRYIKPALTLAVLVIAMAISMLPYCIYLIIVAVDPRLNDHYVITIMFFIGQLNPALDPVFYAATQKSVRAFYKKKLFRFYKYVRPQV